MIGSDLSPVTCMERDIDDLRGRSDDTLSSLPFLLWHGLLLSFSSHKQDRVGSLKGGIEFLELCGFEKIEGGEFLFLPRDKVDIAVLHSAGSELNSAIVNPFFGVL